MAEPWWQGNVTSMGRGVGLSHRRGSLAAFLFVSHLLALVTVGDNLKGPPRHHLCPPLVSLLLIKNCCPLTWMLIRSRQSHPAFQTPRSCDFVFHVVADVWESFILRAFPMGKPSFIFLTASVIVLEMFAFVTKRSGKMWKQQFFFF